MPLLLVSYTGPIFALWENRWQVAAEHLRLQLLSLWCCMESKRVMLHESHVDVQSLLLEPAHVLLLERSTQQQCCTTTPTRSVCHTSCVS